MRMAAGFLFLSLAFLAPTTPVSATDTAVATPVEQAVAVLCNKRIALLGELPSHGEARAFAAKAAIARALVERCGFTGVLFEAPVYDFVGLEPAWNSGSATRARFDDALGDFWWARELAGFRAWLFEEARLGRVRVGGLDDQVSATSTHARKVLPGMVASRLGGAEAQACRQVVARQIEWSYDDAHPFDDAERRVLGRCAGSAAAAATSGPSDEAALLANFDRLVLRTIGAKAAEDCDASMHRNLQWYLRRWPVTGKVVVWTATVHAARRADDLSAKPLGAWLADTHGDEVASIGFSALSGASSMAGRPAKPLPALGSDSLEAHALGPVLAEAFLGLQSLRALGPVESRLYGRPLKAGWGDRFDGVIVYGEELPASFD